MKSIREKIHELIPEDKKHISNSTLNDVKRFLIGEPAFHGQEKFLHFGSEVHRMILEPDTEKKHEFNEEEQGRIDSIKTVARNDHMLMLSMLDSKCEQSLYGYIEDVKFRIILDIYNEDNNYGADLKTTSVRTEQAFIKAARAYGYFRQSWIYMQVAKLDTFEFFGIQKHTPFEIYRLNVADYQEEMKHAENETKLLIDVIKNNGRMV